MTEQTLHLIHDKKRVDRAELMYRELAEQEIYDYQIWPAVFDQRATFAGISMAHKKIVRYAKTNNWPYVTIAEDDIRFTCKTSWKYYLENKPEDFDIYLGGIYTGHILEGNIVEDFSGLTLYTVNEKFYDKFLEVTVMNHLDRQLARLGKFVVCNPFAAISWTTYSSNKLATVDHWPLLKGRTFYNGKNTKKI